MYGQIEEHIQDRAQHAYVSEAHFKDIIVLKILNTMFFYLPTKPVIRQ